MKQLMRMCVTIMPLLVLSGCLLSPGRFTSTLDIRKDRSFTFTYVGEVIATDPSEGSSTPSDADDTNSGSDGPEEEGVAYYQQIAAQSGGKPPARASEKEAIAAKEKQAKMQSMADALSKEAGFRSVKYVGGNKLEIDYRISGTLDHGFVFPFNIDAQAVIPFIAIELRADGKVRVQAPAFGSESGKSGGPIGDMGGGDTGLKERNGTFTLTTDAEIVSQNQEDGASSTEQGKKIVWKVTPLTRAAPMAVLKFPSMR